MNFGNEVVQEFSLVTTRFCSFFWFIVEPDLKFRQRGDNHIDFKPTSPILKGNTNTYINNTNWHENQQNYSINNSNKINHNIMFNPQIDNIVFSDEGKWLFNHR